MLVQEGFLLVQDTWHVLAEVRIQASRLVRHTGETYDLFPFVDRESDRLRTVWKVEVGEDAVAVKKCMKGALICSQELSDNLASVVNKVCIAPHIFSP